MRKLAKGMVLGALVALLTLVAAPALHAAGGDDVAGFYVAERLLVGSVSLEPGIYLVRPAPSVSGQNVLVVTNVNGTKVFATLLVTPHQIAAHEVSGVSRLLYEPGDAARPNALRTFLAANSSFGYDILPGKARTQLASAGLREITAITWLR